MSLKKEQGEKTKELLIENAQKMFAKKGFAHTRFDEVAKSEKLTTGAMYHHFKNKKELFEKVFEKCSLEVARSVTEKSEKTSNLIESICIGCITYIEIIISSSYKKIMLEDAISVLGWKQWKKIDDQTSEMSLLNALSEAQALGLIHKKYSSKSLARFISGGTNEIALWISESDKDQKKLLTEAKATINHLILSLTKEKSC